MAMVTMSQNLGMVETNSTITEEAYLVMGENNGTLLYHHNWAMDTVRVETHVHIIPC